MNLKTKHKIKLTQIYLAQIIEIVLGAGIMAFGVASFMLPNQLSTGGFSGVATIVYYLLKLPMGTTILVLNIPFFILAVYKIGKRFLFRTLLGAIVFSVFIDIFDKFPALTTDRFLACIYGGIFMGLGTAIILKAKASTGGTELVTSIVREYNSKYRISNLIVMIDTAIVILNVIFFREIEIGLYSAIAIYLMGKIIDIVFEGVYFTKLIFIISEKTERIAKLIGDEVNKGTTGLYGKGMYTGKDSLILMCAASRGDVSRVREIAQKTDPHAFIIISNSREVFGVGFKRE